MPSSARSKSTSRSWMKSSLKSSMSISHKSSSSSSFSSSSSSSLPPPASSFNMRSFFDSLRCSMAALWARKSLVAASSAALGFLDTSFSMVFLLFRNSFSLNSSSAARRSLLRYPSNQSSPIRSFRRSDDLFCFPFRSFRASQSSELFCAFLSRFPSRSSSPSIWRRRSLAFLSFVVWILARKIAMSSAGFPRLACAISSPLIDFRKRCTASFLTGRKPRVFIRSWTSFGSRCPASWSLFQVSSSFSSSCVIWTRSWLTANTFFCSACIFRSSSPPLSFRTNVSALITL
mmetsp:Transcript_26298/g.42281  ORF Transcript_26298/g.42281 Transcript_26298/m.42281 type:complete len:289 (+) Transcript_26298:597-1463(+)